MKVLVLLFVCLDFSEATDGEALPVPYGYSVSPAENRKCNVFMPNILATADTRPQPWSFSFSRVEFFFVFNSCHIFKYNNIYIYIVGWVSGTLPYELHLSGTSFRSQRKPVLFGRRSHVV